MEIKFFTPFQGLHLARKQAYKLEFYKKWNVYDVFHVSLLEQNTTRKRRIDEKVRQIEFDIGDNKEYEVKAIWDNTVYAKESELGRLPGLYYRVSWKRYQEEENTWELALAVQHLKKFISSFYKNHPDKLTTTFPAIDTALPMAKPTVKQIVKPTASSKRK